MYGKFRQARPKPVRGHGPLPALRISVMITAGLDKVEDVPVVEVPMSQIRDWDTFHDTFAQRLGFPDFYGRNMDAWIDCLTYADEDDGMRAITAAQGRSSRSSWRTAGSSVPAAPRSTRS